MVKKRCLIVLGGSSGIGKEIINKIQNRYNICALYNKNKPILKKNSKILRLDLNTNLSNLKEILGPILKNNKNFVLINFAAVKIDKISLFINDNEFDYTVNVNIKSFLKIIQFILPKMMKNNWGRIINISSSGGLKGDKGTALYSLSKSATQTMMKVMSQEYGKFNITFNTIKLGNFNYGLFKVLNKKLKRKIIQKIPSNKTGNISNILSALYFLIDADYVNGSTIDVDGGMN